MIKLCIQSKINANKPNIVRASKKNMYCLQFFLFCLESGTQERISLNGIDPHDIDYNEDTKQEECNTAVEDETEKEFENALVRYFQDQDQETSDRWVIFLSLQFA